MATPAAANDNFFDPLEEEEDQHSQSSNEDDYEQAYDELEHDQDVKEGVFSDRQSVFESDVRRGGPPVQHQNLQVTRDQELQPERLNPKTNDSMQHRQLVAVWDQQGNPQVAMTINGNRVENFRLPTKAEWDALRERGRIVKQPMAFGDAAPSAGTQAGGGFKSWLIGGAILAALGGAFWAYQKYVAEDDELDEEAEEI